MSYARERYYAYSREQECVEYDSEDMVLFKGIAAEYGVQGIAKARPQPYYKAFYSYGIAPSQARYQNASCKCHQKGSQLDRSYLFLEQNKRHQYNKNRRGIEQDYSHRCPRFYYGLEVAEREECQAYDTGAYEHPDIFKLKAQQVPVCDKQVQRHDCRCYQSTNL